MGTGELFHNKHNLGVVSSLESEGRGEGEHLVDVKLTLF